MRDPKRIHDFCNRLAVVWSQVPDWRFGQLIDNVRSENGIDDIFFVEDDKMISMLESYVHINGGAS